MKRIFLLIAIIAIGLPHAALSMQTAGTIKKPVKLLTEAIRKHNALAFTMISSVDKDSLTHSDWLFLQSQNADHTRAIVETQIDDLQNLCSCWKVWFGTCWQENEYLNNHEQIASYIARSIKELPKREMARKLANLEKSVNNIQAVLVQHKLMQEQSQIVSAEVKQ